MIGVGTFKTTDRMKELVSEVLESERISYGPKCQAFERQFSELHDCHYGVWSNSGTSSLLVALQTLKELHAWDDGDEVLVPALTFVATVNVVLHCGLTPVLVDVEPDYYGIDVRKMEEKITGRTRAIIPVHLFGQPCNMAGVSRIAHEYHLRVIEDSCECMFVAHHGIMAGGWGDIGCFSTYVAHLLTTGVGGLSITNNKRYAEVMRSLVNHGRDGIYISIDDGRHTTGGALREVISRRFRFERIGHSFRITELEAALGLAQLEAWEPMIIQRQRNAAYLTSRLKVYDEYIQLPSIRPHTGHAFMMYPLVLRGEPKAELTAFLEERGIETREMLPLTNQPAYASWCDEGAYPVAKWINESGFYIGCHQDLTDDNLASIVQALGAYFVPRVAGIGWSAKEAA